MRPSGSAGDELELGARARTPCPTTATWSRRPPPRLRCPTTPGRNAAAQRILVQRNVTTVHGVARASGEELVVGDPKSRDTEMGPLVSASHRESVAFYVPDDHRGVSPARRPGQDIGPATVLTRSAPIAQSPRRSSEPLSRCCRSMTRPTPSGWPTPASTACPARSGPTICRGRRVSRAVESGNLFGQLALVGAIQRRSADEQSGLGRELGPDAPLASTETKNVFSAIGRT